MKKNLLFLLPLLGAVALAGCDKKCSHADANNDFVCDECGSALAISSVELDTSEAQKLFYKGEKFSAEGVKLIGTSEVGSKKELEFTTSQPDMDTVGDKTVDVIYGEGENDKKSYTINVSYWSEADLAIFKSETLLGHADLGFPYLPGFNMRVEASYGDDEELESWKMVADDITTDGYLDLVANYKSYKETATISGKKVTFSFKEVVVDDAEGFHDLSGVSVFRLSPSYKDQGYSVRFFVYDEYIIMGVNEDGQLVIESRLVNALLDGVFATADKVCDSSLYYPAQYNSYQEVVAELIGAYFSEIAAERFVLPAISEESDFVPVNLGSVYPLAEGLDKYTFAWVMIFENSAESYYTNYIAALTAAGYTPVVEEGVTSYVLDDSEGDDFIGRIEIVPTYSAETKDFGYQLYYNAPEKYEFVVAYQKDILDLLNGLEVADYELDVDYYPEYGDIDAWFEVSATSAEAGLDALIAKLEGLGFNVTDAKAQKALLDGTPYWSAGLSDGSTLDITVNVFEPEEGKSSVCIEIYAYEEPEAAE